jgi:hypothetical protein
MVDLEAPDGKVIARRYSQVMKKTLESREYQEIVHKYYGTDAEAAKAQKTVGRLVEFYMSSWDGRDVGRY